MKLERAIEILRTKVRPCANQPSGEVDKAITLSIEALKRHQKLQASPYYTRLGLLPGETPKEET